MSPKEIYYFLGKCLVLDEIPDIRQKILERFSQTSFSWEQFVQVGSSHLVLPALYVKLQNAGLLHSLPEELANYLGELHTLNIERNKNLLKQVRWLNQLLHQSGIQSVFLKGSGALLQELYPDPGERILSDIDCMVSENDFENTVQVLKMEGYTHPPFHPASLPMMHHYPSLFKAGEPAQVEIHKFPVGRRQLRYLKLEDMNARLLQLDKPDGPTILSGGDQILINVIHSQLKDRGQYYANISLRNIYEFYRLTRKHELSETGILHPRLKLVLNNYMAVAEKLFAPASAFPVQRRVRTQFFTIRFELNKSSRIYNRLSKLIRSLADLFYTYFYIISRAVIQKDYRRYLRIRLTNPAWYRHHLSVIVKRFDP